MRFVISSERHSFPLVYMPHFFLCCKHAQIYRISHVTGIRYVVSPYCIWLLINQFLCDHDHEQTLWISFAYIIVSFDVYTYTSCNPMWSVHKAVLLLLVISAA